MKHLICSSYGFPLKAFQLIIIIPSMPVNNPHMAVDAPTALLSGLTTQLNNVPPILN